MGHFILLYNGIIILKKREVSKERSKRIFQLNSNIHGNGPYSRSIPFFFYLVVRLIAIFITFILLAYFYQFADKTANVFLRLGVKYKCWKKGGRNSIIRGRKYCFKDGCYVRGSSQAGHS